MRQWRHRLDRQKGCGKRKHVIPQGLPEPKKEVVHAPVFLAIHTAIGGKCQP